MAINPPSDIVLDVARAVDPAKLQAATDKLARMAAAGTAQSDDFSQVLGAAQAAAETRAASSPVVDLFDLRNRLAAPASASTPGGRPASAYQGLEAVVLQSFIGYMLPQNADSFFGEGTAGEMWRSLLAEQLATQMAKTGKIGLAKTFAAHAQAAQAARTTAAVSDLPAAPAAGAQAAAAVLSDLPMRSGEPGLAPPAAGRGVFQRDSRART